MRLVMGRPTARARPVEFPHESLFAEAVLAPGAVLPLDPDYDERAVYVASGEIDIAGDTFAEGRLLVFKPGDRISILANAQSRLMLLGGEPMDGPRHIWWNFVSSSKERIEQAKRTGEPSASRSCRATRRSSFRCPSETRGARRPRRRCGGAWSSGGSSRAYCGRVEMLSSWLGEPGSREAVMCWRRARRSAWRWRSGALRWQRQRTVSAVQSTRAKRRR